MHVEGIDKAGHEGNLKLKSKCIEEWDKRLLGRVLENLKEEVRIAVLPDHPTPVELKTHIAEPIPFIVYDKTQRSDNIQQFDELSCSKGSYGLLEKDQFIRAVLEK